MIQTRPLVLEESTKNINSKQVLRASGSECTFSPYFLFNQCKNFVFMKGSQCGLPRMCACPGQITLFSTFPQ